MEAEGSKDTDMKDDKEDITYSKAALESMKYLDVIALHC